MFDRMIFKGQLSRRYAPGALRAWLWELGYPLTDFARYAAAATERLTANAVDEHGRRERRWCKNRKGVANLWRDYQVGSGANRRYLDALAAAALQGEGVAALDALCRPRTKRGGHYARFNPLSSTDPALFRAVLAGEHAIVGFRNHDIAARLYHRPPATATKRTAGANGSPASSTSFAATASSPKSHAAVSTGPPPTATAS